MKAHGTEAPMAFQQHRRTAFLWHWAVFRSGFCGVFLAVEHNFSSLFDPLVKINHKPFSAAGIDRIRELQAKNRNCDTDEMYFHRNHNWEALSKTMIFI